MLISPCGRLHELCAANRMGWSTALPPPQVDFSQSVSHLWRQFKVRGNTADAATGQMANSGGGGGPPGAVVGGGSGCYNCGETGERCTNLQTRRWCYNHYFVKWNNLWLFNLSVCHKICLVGLCKRWTMIARPCWIAGHLARECPNPRVAGGGRGCYNCGQPGASPCTDQETPSTG